MKQENKFPFGVKNVILLIIAIAVCRGMWYLMYPALSIHSVEFWIMTIINVVIFLPAIIPAKECSKSKLQWIPSGLGFIVIFCSILFLIIGWISTWKIFNVDNYRNRAVVSEGANFTEDFPKLTDSSNIPYVDLETARKLGDRTIGKLSHSSWYEVDDEYNLICYKGEYYRLSPLGYAGFFEFNKAEKDGIPGYVLVNAKTQEANFIQVDGGYFYSPTACWGKNLNRHLRKQFPNYIFGNSYFEIDEDGKPYWVTAVNKTTVGIFAGYKEEEFIITDAITGESKIYNKEEIPNWVDHAVSLGYSMEVLDKYYSLVHGVWNWSNTDVYKTTYNYRDENFTGYNSFIDSQGNVCFYTGLTPANNAESNTGFLLINCRTGDTREYLFEDDNGGIEESTGMERAESEVQNFGYKATFPLMVNIAGEPTYLMCLKGNDGLVKQIALAIVSTKSSTIVTSDNLESAIKKYESELIKANIIDNNGIDVKVTGEAESITGTITAKYDITVDGTTHYLYKIDESTTLYDASVKYGYAQAAYMVGDIIKITYESSDNDVKTAIKIEK